MSVKAIGSIVLILTAIYYSSAKQTQEKRKQQLLAELCALFAHIQKNIERYTLPLGEIYRGYTSPLLAQMDFYIYWQKGDLQEAVRQLSGIPESARSVLQQYAENAGKGYKDTEIQLCLSVRESLEEALQRQEQDVKIKNKMYRTLPFLLVISVVLLFA